MKQIYENYTAEDQKVWKILFDRQFPELPKAATKEFLLGLDKVNFTADAIPNFDDTNKILRQLTGWEIYAVPGIVEDGLFFELMSNKKFPATTWVRKMSQLDYLEEPDMFHDVFAHIPLLTNQAFVDFLQAISQFGHEWIEDEWAIHLLSRIYWFTIEFGLIRETEGLRIYGAGILSSSGETKYSLSNEPNHFAYDVDHILDTGYRKDRMQENYFIIDSYEQLYESIPEIKEKIEKRLKERPVVS
ncbi:phenylalanine 4-monooxygenase [Roseivirga sp. UBA1976]|uniref:phenylalanine 4-monooxygenase n=1 Tax=Roseivirga sp. UBA1976 TaxID=1947386 RepID=UPI00257E8589|nr:phenylalanine 4-monooxygenase [Roseivirga sp. UBA1976]|tara:strand:+ start:11710 stop:12444 length:735 start_codon:yes stop_codon:yes gene_type:complete